MYQKAEVCAWTINECRKSKRSVVLLRRQVLFLKIKSVFLERAFKVLECVFTYNGEKKKKTQSMINIPKLRISFLLFFLDNI